VYEVLNVKYYECEVVIVVQVGCKGVVMVVMNMVG